MKDLESLGLEYVTGTGSDIPAGIWGRDLPASEIAPVAKQPTKLEQNAAQSTVSEQPARARNETAPVEAENPEDSETDSDSDSDSDSESELLTVERLQQWARELEQEKDWKTDVAAFQAIRKGERESQNQTAGDAAKSIAKKDGDAEPTA